MADIFDKYRVAPAPVPEADPFAQYRTAPTEDPFAKYRTAPADDPFGPQQPPQRSLGGKIWDAGKSGLMGALELAGRPGEFVSGTVAGSKDGLKAGLQRGWNALTEGNIADSKIQENFSKVMDERGILKDSPITRGLTGFAADMVTDPTNLLGGAGMIRKGVIKGATELGVAKKVAEQAVGLGVRDGFQAGVIKPISKVINAATPTWLNPQKSLKNIVGKSGLSAEQMNYLAQKTLQDKNNTAMKVVNSIQREHKLSIDERKMLTEAIASPQSAHAKTIEDLAQQGDTRLLEAKLKAQKIYDSAYMKDTAAGRMKLEQPLKDAKFENGHIITQLKNFKPSDPRLKMVEDAIKANLDQHGFADSDVILAALPDKQTRALAEAIIRENESVTDGVRYAAADLKSLKFEPGFDLNRQAMTMPMVSTKNPNYVNQVYPKIPEVGESLIKTTYPRLKEANAKVRDFGEAMQNGAETDLAKLLQTRLASSNRAEVHTELLRKYGTEFGEWTPGKNTRPLTPLAVKDLPDPLKQIFSKVDPATGKVDYLHLPTDVADHIEGYITKLNDGPQLEGVIRRGLKLFKTYATTMNFPGHQATNFLGNVTNMWASSDMRPDEVMKGIAEATSALTMGGKLSPVVVGTHKLDSPDILRLAQKYGVYGDATGFAGEFANNPEKLTDTAKLIFGQKGNPGAVLNPDNALVEKLRHVNQAGIEDPAKVAFFHWNLKQGKTPEQAALEVRRVLFDYSDLNDFEKSSMRQVIPFYTWTRKNLPLQIANIAQRPAKAANQKRLLDLAWELSKSDDVTDVDRERLPSFFQSGEVLPFPGIEGTDKMPVYTRLRLPMMDLNLLSTDPEQFASKAGFMLNPLMRMAIEDKLLGHRIGDPEYRAIGQKDVPAGILGRLAGMAGVPSLALAHADPETGKMRQTARARWAQEAIPVPLGGALRTLDSQGNTDTNMNAALELFLRSVGLTPNQLSEEALARADADRSRKAGQ